MRHNALLEESEESPDGRWLNTSYVLGTEAVFASDNISAFCCQIESGIYGMEHVSRQTEGLDNWLRRGLRWNSTRIMEFLGERMVQDDVHMPTDQWINVLEAKSTPAVKNVWEKLVR
eukprot:TRINITY_DN10855_c0_g2_i4.p1 TRINITY_DN10855_c0_g2~~TRINITY_DN10855_c0_g2_i4.p1  ORF type:complete len:117 (-),score=20.86 TRINITY_DN10855_c0_g2_i4:32-382(-)